MKTLSDTDQYKHFQSGEPNGNIRTAQVQKAVLNYKPRVTFSIIGTVIVSNTLMPYTSLLVIPNLVYLVIPNNLQLGEVKFIFT